MQHLIGLPTVTTIVNVTMANNALVELQVNNTGVIQRVPPKMQKSQLLNYHHVGRAVLVKA